MVLARNKELEGVIQSVKSIERHFNRWFHYPYVFLNDGIFNETFKETVLNYTSSTVEWGQISAEDWGFPDWADPAVTKEGIARQGDNAIMYGSMESYHHMCRFYSGYVLGVWLVETSTDFFLGNFTTTSYYSNTNGIGVWNPISNTSVTSHTIRSFT